MASLLSRLVLANRPRASQRSLRPSFRETFTGGWSIEVLFPKVHGDLGVETTRGDAACPTVGESGIESAPIALLKNASSFRRRIQSFNTRYQALLWCLRLKCNVLNDRCCTRAAWATIFYTNGEEPNFECPVPQRHLYLLKAPLVVPVDDCGLRRLLLSLTAAETRPTLSIGAGRCPALSS